LDTVKTNPAAADRHFRSRGCSLGQISEEWTGKPPVAARTVRLDAFLRKVTLDRRLRASADKVFVDAPPPTPDQADALLALYAEVCASWRALVDVRFKLLGFVPAVSGVALAALLNHHRLDRTAGVGVAVYGFAVTFALFVYDQRNSQLHDELISRGRRIELELGVDVGQFRGRPDPWKFVEHDLAVVAVYVVTLLAWVFAAVVFATRG
jgi:hypothetical protein